MKQTKFIHTQQQEETDCGVACLLSVLRYFGGNASLNQLRDWSGTSISGTSLLGLYEAAQKVGIKAEGFEAEIEHLQELTTPAILHVVKEQLLPHYVVCYAYDKAKDVFLISDPAEIAIKSYTPDELAEIWQTKTLLLVEPTDAIVKQANTNGVISTIKWLYGFAEPDINLLFIALVMGAFVSALGLSIAIFSQKLVDIILPAKDISKLLKGVGLLTFLLMVRVLFSYLRQYLLLNQSKDFNIRIVDFFFSSLLKLPKTFFDSRKTGELIARMNDTSRIQQTISNIFTNLAIEVIIIILSSVALFYYHVQVGFAALLWLPFFGTIVYLYNTKIINGQRRVMAAYAMNESHYIDVIQGAGVIKATNKEDLFADITKRIYELFQETRYQLGMIGNSFGIVTQLTMTIFTVGIILFSSLLVLNGKLSIGSVMAVVQMIGSVMESASTIAVISISLQEAKIAIERMQEFTTIPAEYQPEQEQAKHHTSVFDSLIVSQLDFRFTGRPLLLSDISFWLKKGEIIAITGESGGGKSTLLQILQGFYQPEKGDIILNGVPLNQVSLVDWRRLFGVVPQQVKIFNGNLIDNILLGQTTEEEAQKVIAFCQEIGLGAYFERFPQGYFTILGESGVNISGGQQQLVGIARALYHKPQLLLLDEATASMDVKTERFVLDLLVGLKSTVGILMITHRSQTQSVADRVYRIEDGQMVNS